MRVMEQVWKAEAVKIKGKGISRPSDLHQNQESAALANIFACLSLHLKKSQKGGCKQEVILSNTPDCLKCRASFSSLIVLSACKFLHCFCILKVECQAARSFLLLTFASLWVSFPQARNMSGRMQSQGSWRRGRKLSQKVDFYTF